MSKKKLTKEQKASILTALNAWQFAEDKMREYTDAHSAWIEEFNKIWDGSADGAGPMWTEFNRLRDRARGK